MPSGKARWTRQHVFGSRPRCESVNEEGDTGMPVVEDPTETGRLLHRRDELVRRQELLSERVALFENPVSRRQLDELTIEISLVRERLSEVGVFSS